MEFPHLQALYDELKGKGLAVVALTGSTAPDSARAFIDHNHITIPLVLAEYDDAKGVFEKYHANNGTHYIVNGAGKIVYAGGYDMAAMRKVLASLGVK